MDFLPIKFTFKFVELFVTGLFMVSPVLLFLAGLLCGIARITCNIEKWQSYTKSLYFTFITALTVGYGKTVPGSGWGRFLSIVSAFIGVILTGVIVSVALNSVMISWQSTHDTPMEASIESELSAFENSAFHQNGERSSAAVLDSSTFSRSDSLSIPTDS